MSAIAELERSMIRERSKAGLAAARARGRKGGRPFALKGQDRIDAMLLIESGRDTRYVMDKYKVSRSTVDRNWQRWKAERQINSVGPSGSAASPAHPSAQADSP